MNRSSAFKTSIVTLFMVALLMPILQMKTHWLPRAALDREPDARATAASGRIAKSSGIYP